MRISAALPALALLTGCFDPEPAAPSVGDETDVGSTTGDLPTPSTGGSMETDDPPTGPSAPTMGEESSATQPTESGDLPLPDCDAAGGAPDPSCPAGAPFCVDGTCASCSDAPDTACAELSASSPVCSPEGSCIGCTAHDECSSGACDIFTGACFEAANALYVDSEVACGGAGTEASPMCSVADALDAIDQQAPDTRWLVRLAGSAAPYADALQSQPSRAIAVLGPADGLTARIATASSAMRVDGGRLYAVRLRLESDGPSVVAVTDGEAYLHDVEVVNAGASIGVDVTGGELEAHGVSIGNDFYPAVNVGAAAFVRMYDSVMDGNAGGMTIAGDAELRRVVISGNYVEGGIELTGTLLLENSFLFDNYYARGSLEVSPPAVATIVYSTLMDGIECSEAVTASVRNSIVVGGFACASATVDNSAVDMVAVDQGSGNTFIPAQEYAAVFVDPDNEDFHLQPTTIVTDVARWQSGDPTTDFDGDARPNEEDAADTPGADVPEE